MIVYVVENNIEKALKQLKRKLQREGVLRDMRRHEHFQPESVRKRLRREETLKRIRKAAKRKHEREMMTAAQREEAKQKAGLGRPHSTNGRHR